MARPKRALEDVLSALVSAAPPEVTRSFGPASCIPATRVAVEALARFGVSSHAVPVQVHAFNREAWALREAPREVLLADGRAWSLGVGFTASAPKEIQRSNVPGYDGHLVVRAEEWLVDLSIAQVNRPARGIVFEPFAVRVPSEFWESQESRVLENADGARLLVRVHASDDGSWRRSKLWLDESRITPVVVRVVRGMEKSFVRR